MCADDATRTRAGLRRRQTRSSPLPSRRRTRQCRSSRRRASAAPAPAGRRRSASCRRRRAARPGRTTRARGRGAASSRAPPGRAGGRARSRRARAARDRTRALRRSAQKPTPMSAAPTIRSLHAEIVSIGGSRVPQQHRQRGHDDDAGGVADAPGPAGEPAAAAVVDGERRRRRRGGPGRRARERIRRARRSEREHQALSMHSRR